MPCYRINKITSSTPTVVSWATGTDAQIVAMVEAAQRGEIDLTDYWQVGQERTFNLSAMSATGVSESHSAQTVTMVLVDKNNTNYTYATTPSSGRTTPFFIVQQKNGLTETGYMNSSDTNSGSWNGCKRRTWCNNVYRQAIPSTIRDIFHQVKVKTISTYNDSTMQESDDYFFLPAEREIFDSRAYSNSTEFNALSQWEYYTTAAYRIKKLGDSGSASYWWERSPSYNYSTSFCRVSDGGSARMGGAYSGFLIAPVGCI